MSSHIEQRCVQHGLRLTRQRRVIARVLDAAKDHPTVEELHRRVQQDDAGISLATVYRTLKEFQRANIVARRDFGQGAARFEHTPHDEHHHHHLIDMDSGKVLEFHNHDLEAMLETIAEQLGYDLVEHRLELFGVKKAQRAASRQTKHSA